MTSEIQEPADSNKSILSTSWRHLEERWPLIMATMLLRELVALGIMMLTLAAFIDLKGWNILIALGVRTVVWAALQPGYLRFSLNISQGREARITDLFSQTRNCMPFLAATICFAVASALGLVILVVPGLFLVTRWALYGFSIIESKANPVSALATSNRLLTGFGRITFATLVIYSLALTTTVLDYAAQAFLLITLCVIYEQAVARSAQA